MNHNIEIQRLKDFFGANFHEDWRDEASEPEDVLKEFLREKWSADDLKILSESISTFASLHSDEELQLRLFEELGCYYDPTGEFGSARNWLNSIASRFSQEAAARS